MFSGGFDSIGKSLIYIGVIIAVIGLALHFGGKYISFGRLPGDIRIEKENFGFYFPIVSSILLSIVLTILLNLFTRR
jgi:NAD/NADP transhydrogenase beta subunit